MSNEVKVREIVRTHGPIKARQIVEILNNDYGIGLDRSGVNSILYGMKSAGEARIDSSYRWVLSGGGHSVNRSSAVSQSESIPAQPQFVFTPEQQRVIDLDTNGNLLIRGQAGSGKTTVLAARAGRILSGVSSGSMLFLTYNAALCTYVRKAFRDARLYKQMRVSTYHEWARSFAAEMGCKLGKWVSGKDKSSILGEVVSSTSRGGLNHRLFNIEGDERLLPWWGEEIAWIYGQGIETQDDYLRVERVGRGTLIRLSGADRTVVWDIFQKYNAELSDCGLEDYDNAGGVLLRILREKGGVPPEKLRYDHVFIDEVQDFHQSWLMALAPVARTSLSMAGDLAQKIYKRSFTWKSVGIEVHGGRSKRLGGSHRTTKQIMEVALQLIDNTDVQFSEDYVAPTIPDRNGPKVSRIVRASARDAYSAGCDFIKSSFGRLRAKSVAVALPINKQAYGSKSHLNRLGLKCNVLKGGSLGSFSGGVAVTTYHQLKGLEFDHIVLMGLDDHNFPGKYIEGIEEEDLAAELCCLRRLIYVAMTRAKESVTLVGSTPFCRFFDDVPAGLFDDL